MQWPWSNPYKELAERLKESEEDLKLIPMEDVFNYLKNMPKPNFFVRQYRNLTYFLNNKVWVIYRWFKPCHPKIRKAIPRGWADLDYVIREMNFAALVEFYEEEYEGYEEDPTFLSINEENKKFDEWIHSAYSHITKHRKEMEKEIENISCWDTEDLDEKSKCYEDLLEKETILDKADTKVLVEIIQNRFKMWF